MAERPAVPLATVGVDSEVVSADGARRPEGPGQGPGLGSDPDQNPVPVPVPVPVLPATDRGEISNGTTDAGLQIFTPDSSGIRSAVREKIPEIKDCYESWLKMSPKLAGKLTFSFAILSTDTDGGLDPSGLARVGEVTLRDSTMRHPFMEGCVADVFSELRFQRPEGGRMDVTYPLAFSADDPDAG